MVAVNQDWEMELPPATQQQGLPLAYEVDKGQASFLSFDASANKLSISAGASGLEIGTYDFKVFAKVQDTDVKSEGLPISLKVIGQVPNDFIIDDL